MTTKAGTIYRKTALVGTSPLGYDDAIQRALERAQRTLRHLKWFEVTGQRGRGSMAPSSFRSSWRSGLLWRTRWCKRGTGLGPRRHRAALPTRPPRAAHAARGLSRGSLEEQQGSVQGDSLPCRRAPEEGRS